MNAFDQQLEYRIAEQALILSAHPDREARKRAFERLQELNKQRSAERVLHMEEQKQIQSA